MVNFLSRTTSLPDVTSNDAPKGNIFSYDPVLAGREVILATGFTGVPPEIVNFIDTALILVGVDKTCFRTTNVPADSAVPTPEIST